MDSIPDLDEVVADLATVWDADLLSELKEQIAYGMRGRPRNDLDAFPWLKHDIDVFTDILVDLTHMPKQLCQLAAIRHFLPECRSRDAIDILHRLADAARAAQAKERASTIIDAERRRLASQRRHAS